MGARSLSVLLVRAVGGRSGPALAALVRVPGPEKTCEKRAEQYHEANSPAPPAAGNSTLEETYHFICEPVLQQIGSQSYLPPNPASHLLALEDVLGPKPSGIYKGDDLGQLVSESAIINTSLSGKSDNPSPLQYTLLLYSVRIL